MDHLDFPAFEEKLRGCQYHRACTILYVNFASFHSLIQEQVEASIVFDRPLKMWSVVRGNVSRSN